MNKHETKHEGGINMGKETQASEEQMDAAFLKAMQDPEKRQRIIEILTQDDPIT